MHNSQTGQTDCPDPDDSTLPKMCEVKLYGHVECCCDENPAVDLRDYTNELIKLPCSTTCDEAYTFISNFLASNPGALLTEAMNFFNDGWLLVFAVPPASP